MSGHRRTGTRPGSAAASRKAAGLGKVWLMLRVRDMLLGALLLALLCSLSGCAMLGVTLAPRSAVELSRLIIRGESDPVLRPFSADRFA